MATLLQLKRSSTSGSEPTANDLQTAELAINTADAKLFTKDGNNNILELTFGNNELILDDSVITTNSTVTNSITSTVVDSFAIADFRLAKYLIQIASGSDYQATEILFLHDGSTTYLTEYATIVTNGILGVFDGTISGTDAQLSVESASSTTTTYKLTRIGVRA